MDLYSGRPVWIAGAGPTRARPLVRDTECDVAVIGAGVTGALVADALLDRGLRVVVLDRSAPGCGSTAASTALLMYDLDVPLHRLIGMIGPRAARRAFALGVDAIGRLETICAGLPPCGFARRTSVYFTREAGAVPELHREFEARRDAGIAVEWCVGDAPRTRFGMDVAAAIVSADGAQVDPYLLTRLLLRRCGARGAAVFGGTPVASLRADAGGVLATTGGGATVRSSRAVVATGYEAQGFVRLPEAETASTYVVSCRAASPPPERPVAWEFASPYLYTRWTEGGVLLIGGLDEGFSDPAARDALRARKSEELLEGARRLYPGLRLEREGDWAGTFGSTRDGLGFVGPAREAPAIFFALGFGGNGITLSAAGAVIVADLVMGRANPDAALFALDRGGPDCDAGQGGRPLK